MTTRSSFTTVARAALAGLCLFTAAGCGGELLRTGRAPVYLVVNRVTASAGGGEEEVAFLTSDVRHADGSVFNDNATVFLRIEQKNTQFPTSPLNAVTMTRYRVVFRRTDGRNAPGTDVPYPFDGALTATVDPGGETGVAFEIVRHHMKLEPPLVNLAGFDQVGRSISGQGFISTIAEITLWGRDQNGNEVVATAALDVHFGDFADEE